MSEPWTNWGRNQSAMIARLLTPVSTAEVADVVASGSRDGRRIKVLGSGHSFTGIAAPAQDQMRLDHLRGIVDVDQDRRRVRVLAGTPLHELNPALERLGLAMPNLGDIDQQTIAGAIATGTHGTGVRLQGLASTVVGLALVAGTGETLRISETENADLLPAARVGLGALGIVTEVELQLVPAFRLRAIEEPDALDGVLERVHDLAEEHRHFEFYWFPHTDRVQTKRNDVVDAMHAGRPLPRWREAMDDRFLANTVFEGVNRVVSRAPGLAPRINQLSARALSARDYTDTSYKVFCTQRSVRFTESEYAVPRASVVPVLQALRAWVDEHDERLPFPVEVRFAAADDTWLSTAYERDNAYIAVHQYHRMDNSRYFAAFESIVAEHAGRPHWGKLHAADAAALRELYPRFGDFIALRDRLDPHRTFQNPYLARVLGD